MARIIVTHTHPDLDAIGAAWLLQRYGGLSDCTVRFVNTGDPDKELLEQATAVVDTGGVYEPDMWRFDHHQDTRIPQSATVLVFDYLMSEPGGVLDVAHLTPLVNLIHWGDTGDSRANQSREVGLHALLSGLWPEIANDTLIYNIVTDWLNTLDYTLRTKHAARELLQQHTVYRSEDGKFVAIKDAPGSVTGAAFEQGAEVVLVQSEHETADGTSYAIGMRRNQAVSSPHLGQLVQRLRDSSWDTEILAESDRWFKHPVGFFAGRGTRKAPVLTPITIDLAALAAEFDRLWER